MPGTRGQGPLNRDRVGCPGTVGHIWKHLGASGSSIIRRVPFLFVVARRHVIWKHSRMALYLRWNECIHGPINTCITLSDSSSAIRSFAYPPICLYRNPRNRLYISARSSPFSHSLTSLSCAAPEPPRFCPHDPEFGCTPFISYTLSLLSCSAGV